MTFLPITHSICTIVLKFIGVILRKKKCHVFFFLENPYLLSYDNTSHGISFAGTAPATNENIVSNCTIDGNTGVATDGVVFRPDAEDDGSYIFNSIISNNGDDGVHYTVDGTFFIEVNDYNNYFNNTGNAIDNAGTNTAVNDNDQEVDPGFTDAANDDFSIGTALKADGYPGAYDSGNTTSFLDLGGAQRQEPAGGGTTAHTFA